MSSLKRSNKDILLSGVCAGIAEEMSISPVWIRLLFIVGFPYSLVVYIIGLMFMEK